MNSQSFLDTLLFCQFLGFTGAHRFFTGYRLIGTLQLLTLGGLGIWTIVDFVAICIDKYKNSKGQKLEKYSKAIGISVLVVNIIIAQLILLLPIIIILAAMTGCGCK